MTTQELSRVDAAIEYAVTELSKADPIIEQIRYEYCSIVVTDENDEEGYRQASEATKRMVRLRNDVEKTRKDLKADALRYGKAVDTEAKRIQALIEPIETHLKQQKAIVDNAEAERQRIEHEQRVSWLRGRIDTANSIEWIVTAEELERMPDEEFEMRVISARRVFDERQAERAELEEFRRMKAEREASERAAKLAPIKERLEVIAEAVEAIPAITGEAMLTDQVTEILVSAAERIRRLV